MNLKDDFEYALSQPEETAFIVIIMFLLMALLLAGYHFLF